MSDRYKDRDMADYNISASQVKTHSRCPLQYWFRYIEGKQNTKKNSDFVKLGSRVHESIEEIFTGEDGNVDHPPLHDRDILRSIVRNHYAEREQPWLPTYLYNRGLSCCETIADFIHKHDPDIKGIEARVEFDITRADMETGVTAIMDVVTDKEVWDWKTGRIRDDSAHEEKIQGSIYMAAYYHLFGREPEAIRFVYASPKASDAGAKVRTLEPTDENWDYMLSRAKALLNAKKTGEFPGKPSEDNCYWCGYEMWCSESQVGVGDLSWVDI